MNDNKQPIQKIDTLTEDYATSVVPESKTVSGWQLALIIIGVGISMPSFITGTKLGAAMGIYKAFWSFIIGGLILCVIGTFMVIISVRTRLSTYMLVKFSFGSSGAHIVNLVLLSTLFGWFGVNAHQFGESLYSIFTTYYAHSPNVELLVIVGSILMIATVLFGFKALDKLATLAVPLLLTMLIAMVWLSLSRAGTDSLSLLAAQGEMSFGLGISALVGGKIISIAVLPDLARYVKNTTHGILAVILSFAIAVPLFYIAAAIPALLTGETQPVQIISALGLSAYTLFIIILVVWTTNTNNLYSASLSASAIAPKIKSWKSTVIVGVLGTAFALSGATDYFIDFLLLLGIAIPPISGIMIVDYFFLQRNYYQLENLTSNKAYSPSALIAWSCGCFIAYLGVYHSLSFTHIPAFDGLLIAGVVHCLISRLIPILSGSKEVT